VGNSHGEKKRHKTIRGGTQVFGRNAKENFKGDKGSYIQKGVTKLNGKKGQPKGTWRETQATKGKKGPNRISNKNPEIKKMGNRRRELQKFKKTWEINEKTVHLGGGHSVGCGG